MDPRDIQACVYEAVQQLLEDDAYLLHSNVSERAISHRLAIYIEAAFRRRGSDLHVDCEYNRDLDEQKVLDILNNILPRPRRKQRLDSIVAVTVYPDIIVHERSTNVRNALVIEMKKIPSAIHPDYDCTKLRGYKQDLNYCCAAAVRLSALPLGAEIEWIVVGRDFGTGRAVDRGPFDQYGARRDAGSCLC
jgi:hypothetical protein